MASSAPTSAANPEKNRAKARPIIPMRSARFGGPPPWILAGGRALTTRTTGGEDGGIEGPSRGPNGDGHLKCDDGRLLVPVSVSHQVGDRRPIMGHAVAHIFGADHHMNGEQGGIVRGPNDE